MTNIYMAGVILHTSCFKTDGLRKPTALPVVVPGEAS